MAHKYPRIVGKPRRPLMALYITLSHGMLGKAYGYKLIDGRLWLGVEMASSDGFLKQPSESQPIGHYVHKDGGLEPISGLMPRPWLRITRRLQGCRFVRYPKRLTSLDVVKGPPIPTLTQADEA